MKARAEERRAEEERLRQELGVACVACRDTGGESPYFCDCDRGQAAARADREARFRTDLDSALGIPTRFRSLTLDTYPAPDAPVIARLRAWLDGHDRQRGLLLAGPFGRGKSAALVDVLRRLVTAEAARDGFASMGDGRFLPIGGHPAKRLGCFRTGPGLLQSLRPSDGGRFGANEDTLRYYQRVRILAIDDLGAERLTAWGADRLFEIVNERHNELRPMLLTSNLTLNALATKWNEQVGDGESGDRIVNRLFESCDVIAFGDDAPNWRMRRGAA